MQNHTMLRMSFTILVVSSTFLFPALVKGQSETYDATMLNGGYTYAISGSAADPDGGSDLIVEAGRLAADGAGHVSGTDTVSINGDLVRRTFTGAYTINADGTGAMVLDPSWGPQIHADLVAGNGGRILRMVLTDSGNTIAGIVEAQPAPQSNNAGLLNGGYEYKIFGSAADFYGNSTPIGEIGKLTMDGAGNVTGRSTVSVNGSIVRRTLTGTYTIEPDGSGSMVLYPSWGPPLNADLFVSGNGVKVDFVVTDASNSLAGVMSAQVLPPSTPAE